MHSPQQRKTEIRRSIELLTQVTQADKLRDNASMIEAQRQFQNLRDELSTSDQSALMLLASLGERLAGQLYKAGELSGEALGSIVGEIAEHLAKDLAFREDPKGAMSRTQLKMSMGEVRLALRDGQRLGELLVKMTMLTPEQVEEAVKVQRSSGQRLGEALLQMRLLTPDMLESALRVQKTKRGAASKTDNWSTHRRA
jgi:hypothetical protein